MKKATTILKEINKLEEELYSNYTNQEIMNAFNKLEKEGFVFSVTGLLDVIYEGVSSQLYLETEYPDA